MMVGQLARRAGVGAQTVRYYERRGLLPTAARTAAGYRQYGDEALIRLHFIRRAQDLGFSLREIRELLELRVPGRTASACAAVEARTRDKVALVDRKIAQLSRLRGSLTNLAAACRARRPTGDCPMLEWLELDEVNRGRS